MEETEAHGLRLIAQLRRESEQVHIPRWKLFSGPLVLTPVLLVTILLFFWGSSNARLFRLFYFSLLHQRGKDPLYLLSFFGEYAFVTWNC
jgi:hypothetical protein